MSRKPERSTARFAACVAIMTLAATTAAASSHMDAPLITLDDAANTTDVYAFVTEEDGTKYLSTALSVYPFEEPGIGPNNFRFDDDVRYEIHVSTGADLDAGRPTFSYHFEFETVFQDPTTILQAFRSDLGPVMNVGGVRQNLFQNYTVTRVDHRSGRSERLGDGVTPPNNQGLVTPEYNQGANGEGPAKEGVSRFNDLDRYTRQAVRVFDSGHAVFAGQRDDAFYADIQAIFEGLAFRSGDDDRFDSQGGFNVHTLALRIPVETIGGDLQQVGVYATTSRRAIRVLRGDEKAPRNLGRWVQVGRQGNPLFNEGLVALQDKDLYNRTSPDRDRELFASYADAPELAELINLVFRFDPPIQETGQADLVGIFIPDMIRVDLSTGPARLAGNPDDVGFSRLGAFGPGDGDTLMSQLTGGPVPGGWPNGRRFGDDVVDIAVTAIVNDLTDTSQPPLVLDGIDNVDANDITFNKVFPYAATPLSGRNHGHH